MVVPPRFVSQQDSPRFFQRFLGGKSRISPILKIDIDDAYYA
jgi:hypothetical protein